MERVEIIIGADLVPTMSNKSFFIKGEVEKIIDSSIISILRDSNIRIFNLEFPLHKNINPIKKCGSNFFAEEETVNGVKQLNPSLVTLANNHILDQGIMGLKSTKEILKKNNISFVGAGNNLVDAAKPYIFNIKDKKIGIYACAETEFTIATNDLAGANPFDPLESLDHIAKLRNECDYLIVLYHGGKEYYRYPSPQLQKTTKKMIEKGADLVLCQHSHCIGCKEEYQGSTIVYGQGNFLFDGSEGECWQTSLLIKISLKKENLTIDYIPLIKNGNGIKLANNNEKKEILSDFEKRSLDILNTDFIKNNYNKLSQDHLERYLRSLAGYGKWISRIDKYILKGALVKIKYNQKKMLAIQNYVECEAHRELLLTGIKKKLNKG